MEEHVLGETLFEAFRQPPESQGTHLSPGMIMDASILVASSSTKSRERKRG